MLIIRTFQHVLMGNAALEKVIRTTDLASRKPWLPDALHRNFLSALDLAVPGFVLGRAGGKIHRIVSSRRPISPCGQRRILKQGFIGPMLEHSGSPVRARSIGQQPFKTESNRAIQRVAHQPLDPYTLYKPSGIVRIPEIVVLQAQCMEKRIIFSADFGCTPPKQEIAAVVPPFLTAVRSRGYGAISNFCFGGTPPMAVFGRS